jgi:hypothetical protein
MTLSPFAAFQTDFGHEPRKVESWSFYTIRAGIALKFGTKKSPVVTVVQPQVITKEPVIVPGSYRGERSTILCTGA